MYSSLLTLSSLICKRRVWTEYIMIFIQAEKHYDLYPIVPSLNSPIDFQCAPNWVHITYPKRFPSTLSNSQFTNFCLFRGLSCSGRWRRTTLTCNTPAFFPYLPNRIHLSSLPSYISRWCVCSFKKSYWTTSAFPVLNFFCTLVVY